jgi:hypothetical protein
LRRAQEHPGRIHMLDAGEEIDRVQYKLGVLIKRLCNLEK